MTEQMSGEDLAIASKLEKDMLRQISDGRPVAYAEMEMMDQLYRKTDGRHGQDYKKQVESFLIGGLGE